MEQKNQNLISRPPIVVVMGHIDHGKTTLLDAILESNVAASESKGITQHIGAYEASGITFLDTPGHEAFSKMRSRGAKVADIAVLVVAADDGVKAQTKEALFAIKGAKIPYVVAINKIDKQNADSDRVKNELAGEEVLLEGRGGTVPYVEISAKTKQGIDKLSEVILLLAELENLAYNPKNFASGVVIESHLDPKRGITSTLLIRDGVLKKGEYIAAGTSLAKARILENFSGEAIDFAKPSSPALVVGFDKLPPVGAEFRAYFTQKEAMEAIRASAAADLAVGPLSPRKRGDVPSERTPQPATNGETAAASLGLVIKTDVLGSGEAIKHEIEKIDSEGVDIKFLRIDAGDVSEDDVKLAASSKNSLVLAFRVAVAGSVAELAERMSVEVAKFDVIYEAGDFLRKKIAELAPKNMGPALVGKAKIIKIFSAKATGKNQVIGGKALEGVLKKGAKFDLLRRENKIGAGEIINLQAGRANVGEVKFPDEFGALASSSVAIAAGDTIIIFSDQ